VPRWPRCNSAPSNHSSLSVVDSFKGLISPPFFLPFFFFFNYICTLSHAKNYTILEIQLTLVSDCEGCLVPPSPFNYPQRTEETCWNHTAFGWKTALSCGEHSGEHRRFPSRAAHAGPRRSPSACIRRDSGGCWVRCERAERRSRRGFRCSALLAAEQALWFRVAEWLVASLLENPGCRASPAVWSIFYPPGGQISPSATAVSGLALVAASSALWMCCGRG